MLRAHHNETLKMTVLIVQTIYGYFALATHAYLLWGKRVNFKRGLWVVFNVISILSILLGMTTETIDISLIITTVFFSGATILSLKYILICDYCSAMNKSLTIFNKLYFCHTCGEELDS